MRKRNNRVVFYLDDAEYSAFNEKVKRTSLSREGYIRKVLAGVQIKEGPPADIPYLRREIRRVGSNINQILMLTRVNGFLDTPSLRKALDDLATVNQKIYDAFTMED